MSPARLVQTVQPLTNVASEVVEGPIEVLVELLQTSQTPASQPEIRSADAAAIIALLVGVGFGLFAVVVSFSDPLTAAIWSVVATITTVILMRYRDTNRAMKATAAWIANLRENDDTGDDA